MRKLFIAIVAVAFLVSCGNTETKKEEKPKVEAKEETPSIEKTDEKPSKA